LKRISLPLFLALPVILSACASHELDSQREQWEKVRPAHYSFTYSVTGWAPHWVQKTEVSEGQVVSSTCTNDGKPFDPCENLTIDVVFDRVERSLDGIAELEYDPQWHFPADVSYEGSAEEAGWGFVIRDFTKLE
jgi:hypothetical protein